MYIKCITRAIAEYTAKTNIDLLIGRLADGKHVEKTLTSQQIS